MAIEALTRLSHAPTDSFYEADQRPLYSEWARQGADTDGDGDIDVWYVRKKHGGWDLQRSRRCLAVIPGTVRHVNFGAALGRHQFVIARPDGSGWFYAHCSSRRPHGTYVDAGEYVGDMGNEGTVGVHLHLECLQKWNDWYSTVYSDRLALLWEEGQPMTPEQEARIKAHIDNRIQELAGALFFGNNADGGAIPDGDSWKQGIAAQNLKKILAAAGGGVDPAVLKAQVKQALKEGTDG